MRERDAIESVAVVGAGTMGSGIAQVVGMAGYDVIVRDIDRERVEEGFDTIDDSLSRLVDSETLTEGQATAARDQIGRAHV